MTGAAAEQRVLFTRMHGDVAGLRKLADSVRAAARRSGLPVDQRPYRPHLTLARADGSTDLRPLVEHLSSGAGPGPGQPWVATRLFLVTSLLGAGPDGSSRHESTADWPLTG